MGFLEISLQDEGTFQNSLLDQAHRQIEIFSQERKSLESQNQHRINNLQSSLDKSQEQIQKLNHDKEAYEINYQGLTLTTQKSHETLSNQNHQLQKDYSNLMEKLSQMKSVVGPKLQAEMVGWIKKNWPPISTLSHSISFLRIQF